MENPGTKHIAIIKLSALGDIVHTLPAFALLRSTFPHAEIHWFVSPLGAKLLQNLKGLDKIIPFDLKKKGIGNKLKEINTVLTRYRGKYDLVLDFQGLLKSAGLCALLKGKQSVGFHKDNLRESQARFFYKTTAPLFGEDRHITLKNLHLVTAAAGCNLPAPANGTDKDTPQREPGTSEKENLQPDSTDSLSDKLRTFTCRLREQREIALALLQGNDLAPNHHAGVDSFLERNALEKNNFMVLNVGGGWETKTLPTSRYIELMLNIRDKYPTVVLWGNEKEKKTAEEVCRETGAVLADFFDFSGLTVLLREARLLVSGDTLGLHLADLVNTPSIGIFGPTSPFRNGSLMKNSISLYKKLPCGFCYKRKCGKIGCIERIQNTKIIEGIRTIYETR
ncbi:MAG: glycosyltransferase family 9 protein [bacterium]|nr:glycosyltransferase family 9 protein [bacterium]